MLTKTPGKRYAYKYNFRALKLACEAQQNPMPSDTKEDKLHAIMQTAISDSPGLAQSPASSDTREEDRLPSLASPGRYNHACAAYTRPDGARVGRAEGNILDWLCTGAGSVGGRGVEPEQQLPPGQHGAAEAGVTCHSVCSLPTLVFLQTVVFTNNQPPDSPGKFRAAGKHAW